MALEALKTSARVIGVKQVTKVVNKDLASRVFVAIDADIRVLAPLKNLCAEKNVEVIETATMTEIGNACAIEVGAAAAAILK